MGSILAVCKTLIFGVTLFSRDHDPKYIPETLFTQYVILCNILRIQEVIANLVKILFLCLYDLTN